MSILDNDGIWPAAPGGGSNPHAGQHDTLLPALATLLSPRPDPLRVPAAPHRETESTLPPPVTALDQRFPETPADDLAHVTPRPPLFARRPAFVPPILDRDLPWAERQEWLV